MSTFNLILKLIKCSKKKCKKENDMISNDKEIRNDKMKLEETKDLKEREKLITKIYSNKLQNEVDLCAYKNCKIHKKLYEAKIKSIKDKIKVYNIKLTIDLKKKFNELLKLNEKSILTNEEFLKSIILIQIIQRFINDKVKEINDPFYKLLGDYVSCGKNKCDSLFEEVKKDNILSKKKMSVYSIKDDKKRDKVIRDVYSNEKQVKLDKCITTKCNKLSLNLLQEMIKILNNKAKAFNLKLPEHIKLSNIKKINEEDIPEIIIKLNQLSRYIDKYVGDI
jgi:hypothetical protein